MCFNDELQYKGNIYIFKSKILLPKELRLPKALLLICYIEKNIDIEVGVSTHPLDSPTFVKAYYKQNIK